MFEKIVLRRSDKGPAITIGEIAEALLFYQNVHIILDFGSLNGLIKTLGPQNLLLLLNKPGVSAIYCEDTLGTHTLPTLPFATHKFIEFSFAGSQSAGELTTLKQRLHHTVERLGISKKETKNFVRRFTEKTPAKRLSGNYFVQDGIANAGYADLSDAAYIKEAAARIVLHMTQEKFLPPDFQFSIQTSSDKNFHVICNLDFAEINKILKTRDATLGDFTPAALVNDILMAKADIILASHYGGEFYTSSLTSDLVRLRYDYLLKRIEKENQERSSFIELVFPEGRSIREVINSKERSFEEFLTLLDKAKKFKEWVGSVNPDEKLVKEYFSEISNQGWIASLPAKSLRYVLGLGLSSEPALGAAASLFDSFLAEKIFKGWRPNHFINRNIKPFVEGS